jgi:hypothetical protein
MRVMLYGAAMAALVSAGGCTEYPAAIQSTMAEALPPYYARNNVDMDTAQGMTPVESATHNFGIRISPFQP